MKNKAFFFVLIFPCVLFGPARHSETFCVHIDDESGGQETARCYRSVKKKQKERASFISTVKHYKDKFKKRRDVKSLAKFFIAQNLHGIIGFSSRGTRKELEEYNAEILTIAKHYVEQEEENDEEALFGTTSTQFLLPVTMNPLPEGVVEFVEKQ